MSLIILSFQMPSKALHTFKVCFVTVQWLSIILLALSAVSWLPRNICNLMRLLKNIAITTAIPFAVFFRRQCFIPDCIKLLDFTVISDMNLLIFYSHFLNIVAHIENESFHLILEYSTNNLNLYSTLQSINAFFSPVLFFLLFYFLSRTLEVIIPKTCCVLFA